MVVKASRHPFGWLLEYEEPLRLLYDITGYFHVDHVAPRVYKTLVLAPGAESFLVAGTTTSPTSPRRHSFKAVLLFFFGEHRRIVIF